MEEAGSSETLVTIYESTFQKTTVPISMAVGISDPTCSTAAVCVQL
jgi:hypothetical protein